MKKILIEVVCAATAKSYEFLLPAQMSVGVARKKIIEKDEMDPKQAEEKILRLVEKNVVCEQVKKILTGD